MRINQGRADRVRESLRTATAKALVGTAQALAVASRAAEATARQLRPSEPKAGPGRAPRPPTAAPPAPEPAAPEPARALTGPPPERDTARSPDLAALAGRNAREVIAEVPNLQRSQLRGLRSHEAKGKARKTVLAAIDRALESA